MLKNNFEILQLLLNSDCKQPICQIKAKFLREHYLGHYWSNENGKEEPCCGKKFDFYTIYTNEVFHTNLEAAANFDECRAELKLPRISGEPSELVFYDCTGFSKKDTSNEPKRTKKEQEEYDEIQKTAKSAHHYIFSGRQRL